MSLTRMPRTESTECPATFCVSAGTFSVAKVRALLWLLMVPMGWLIADPAIAADHLLRTEVEGLEPVRVQEDLELARRPPVHLDVGHAGHALEQGRELVR